IWSYRHTVRRTGIKNCQGFLGSELLHPFEHRSLRWWHLLDQIVHRALIRSKLVGRSTSSHLHHVKANREIVSPHCRPALTDLQSQKPAALSWPPSAIALACVIRASRRKPHRLRETPADDPPR